MSTNYNSSVAGTPYVRACTVLIQYPENQIPTVTVTQERAVVLNDGYGTVASLGSFPSVIFNPDMINNATTPIILVDPTTGATLTDGYGNDLTTNYQQIMLGILAAIRQQQLIYNP